MDTKGLVGEHRAQKAEAEPWEQDVLVKAPCYITLTLAFTWLKGFSVTSINFWPSLKYSEHREQTLNSLCTLGYFSPGERRTLPLKMYGGV